MSDPERLSELSSYAYGFSDKRPSRAYWLIVLFIVAFDVYALTEILYS